MSKDLNKLEPVENVKYGKYKTKHEGFEVLVYIYGTRTVFGREELLISSVNGDSKLRRYVTATKVIEVTRKVVKK